MILSCTSTAIESSPTVYSSPFSEKSTELIPILESALSIGAVIGLRDEGLLIVVGPTFNSSGGDLRFPPSLVFPVDFFFCLDFFFVAG